MSSMPTHILLGAGGSIGQPLVQELITRQETVRLVSRNPRNVAGAESVRADLTNQLELLDAVITGGIVYLLAGLPYRSQVWQDQWPKIIQNTVAACREKGARLLFFDNVYAYGQVSGPMTESTPYSPCSRKGEVRAKIAEYVMSEAKAGHLTALIARAADFYGPYADKNSIPFLFVFDKLAKGKTPQCLVNATTRHSYTYTVDCAKALHLLATADDAFGQVWHLPTARPALTGKQFIELAAKVAETKANYSILRKWMVAMAGAFNSQIREVYEMLYQNEYDYLLDSSKFEKRFGFKPTSYEQGIAETMAHFRGRE